MRTTDRWKAVAAVAMLGVLLLSGCTPKDDRIEIKLGEVARTVFYAPQYVALSQGLFTQEGLNVELTTIPGGDKAMTALLSSQADIALIGAETSIYVYQQGAEDPVVNFAQLTQTDGTFLFARNPPEGEFQWKQLMNSTFLGQRKGGMPQMAGEFTLRKHGIHPQGDLKLIQNIDFANIASAFGSGTGDYVQLFEPQASIFEKEGRGRVVASFGAESGHLPYTVYMAKKSYLDTNQESVQKFTNAVYKAQKWVEAHTPEQTAEAILPYFKDIDPAVLASSVKRYKEQGTYASDPVIDEKEWANLQDVMTSAGELKAAVPLSKIVDHHFADQAVTVRKAEDKP